MNKKRPRLIENQLNFPQISSYSIAFFSQQKPPKNKIQAFIPLLSYVRSMLIPLVVVFLVSIPSIQVIAVLVIEIVYMMICILDSNKIDFWEKIIDGYNCASNSLYVILKMVILFTIDDSTALETMDLIMVVIVFINMIVNIGFVLYSLIRYTIIPVVKKGIERCRLTDEQKKMIDKESKWKETLIYQCTDSRVGSQPFDEKDKLKERNRQYYSIMIE